MTQQNETQQESAAAAGQPEQRTPARPELGGAEQQGTSGRAGTPPLPGVPPQSATALQPATAKQPASATQPATATQPTSATQPATATQPTSATQPTAPASALRPPTMFGYEALPEAYLAPPQPGRPRYGAPLLPGSGRPLVGRPGYAEPRRGQPAGGQPGSGQPAPVRPTLSAAARRDPALALPWQRLVAQAIDWMIIIVLSVVVFWSQLSVSWHELQAITGRYPDFRTPAAHAALNSVLRSSSYQHALTYWFLGMFGLAVAYFWVQHAAWGATIGKRAMGMRVVRAADRSRVGVLEAGIRTVTFLAGPAVFLLLGYPVNVVGGVLWAADAGLPVLDPRAQSLHDKLAGTVVVRQSALDESPRRSSQW